MALVFKRNPFDDYEAYSGDCLIGSIEHRTNDKTGEIEYGWAIETLPRSPRWQSTGHVAPDLETAMQQLQSSFEDWLECAQLMPKGEAAIEG